MDSFFFFFFLDYSQINDDDVIASTRSTCQSDSRFRESSKSVFRFSITRKTEDEELETIFETPFTLSLNPH